MPPFVILIRAGRDFPLNIIIPPSLLENTVICVNFIHLIWLLFLRYNDKDRARQKDSFSFNSMCALVAEVVARKICICGLWKIPFQLPRVII